MPEITFLCPVCEAEIEADETMCGGTAQCPACNNCIMVPMPGISQGMKIAGFTLERRLGAGGMGEVWLACQTAMSRKVAIKILSPALIQDAAFVNRFLNEVKTSAKLDHKNIVTAFDAGVEKGFYYLAISYIDGTELIDRIKIDRQISEKEALEIVRDIAEALKYAWNKFKMLHRDIKPSNIMIDSDGVPKLMDMGISKTLSDEGAQMTMAGTIVGTPHYMSPEQGMGERDIDFRSDIYSLGATLYHMVTGSVPYDATTVVGIITKHMMEPLQSPLIRNPGLSDQCAALIETMMAKKRENRQQSWEDVIEDINLVLQGQSPGTKRPDKDQSLIMQATPSQIMNRRQALANQPKARLRDGTLLMESPAQATDIQENAAAPKRFRASFVTVPVLLAIIAGAGYYIKTEMDRFHEAAKSVQEENREKSRPPEKNENTAPVPARTEDTKEKNRQEIWDIAMNYASENPENFDMAIKNFNEVKIKFPDTKYKMMADLEISKIQNRKQDAVKTVISGLKSEAQALLEQKDFEKAADVYKNYSGKLASETSTERNSLAKSCLDMKNKLLEEKNKLEKAQGEKKKEFYSSIIAELIKENYAGAQKLLESPETKDLASELNISFRELEKDNLNKMLLNSFANDVDKDVQIETSKGTVRTKIKKVKGGTVFMEEKIQGGSAYIKLNLNELSPREKFKRFSSAMSPMQIGIYKTVEALKLKKYEIAGKMALETGPLAKAFQEQILAMDTEKIEAAAEKKLTEIFQLLGLSSEFIAKPEKIFPEIPQKRPHPRLAREVLKELEAFQGNYSKTKYAADNKKAVLYLSDIMEKITSRFKERQDGMAPGPIQGGSNRDAHEELNRKLRELNPGYNGQGVFRNEFGRLAVVDLSKCPGIRDISPLRGLNLKSLMLGAEPIDNIEALQGMPLSELQLNCALKDLNFLKGMPLRILFLKNSGITDIVALKGMPLNNLYIDSEITDLNPLKDMPLVSIYIAKARTIDLEPLRNMRLQSAYLPPGINDIGVLKDMPLAFLYMPFSNISDLSPLQGMKLQMLDISGAKITDIGALKGMPLKSLNLQECRNLKDISPLAETVSLEQLAIPPTVSNPQLLKELPSLKQIGPRWPPGPAADFWKEHP